MNRLIKFTGKRVSDNKRMFGCLIIGNETNTQKEKYHTIVTQNNEQKKTGEFSSHIVKPETVGESICRKDLNGADIYESYKIRDDCDTEYIVIYDKKSSSFKADSQGVYKTLIDFTELDEIEIIK